jgi:hypothetical protein
MHPARDAIVRGASEAAQNPERGGSGEAGCPPHIAHDINAAPSVFKLCRISSM